MHSWSMWFCCVFVTAISLWSTGGVYLPVDHMAVCTYLPVMQECFDVLQITHT